MIDAAVNELSPVVGVRKACEAVGEAQARWYRRHRQSPVVARPERVARPQPRALSDAERAKVREVLNSPEHVDQAPATVYAELLDEGIYLASVSSMYRVLRAHDEVRERRRQATHPAAKKPELIAEAPNQVWSWDITKLLGPPPSRDGRDRRQRRADQPKQPRQPLSAGTIVWAAGIRASPVAGLLGAAQIRAQLEGGPTGPFHYRDKGSMATIGRNSAVAELPGRLRFSGFVGWALWLGLHLIELMGFRNRVSVLVNWVWNYLTYDRGARLILGPDHQRLQTPDRS